MSKLASIFLMVAIFAFTGNMMAGFSLFKVLVLSLGLIVISFSAAMSAKITIGPVFWLGVVFLGVSVLSAAFCDDPWLAIIGRYNSYALGILGLCIALLYHLAGGDISILPLTGAILGLIAFIQYVGLGPVHFLGQVILPPTSDLTGNRAYATIGSPTQLGAVLAMTLPLTGSLVYSLAIILGLLATGSRGAILAAGMGLLVAKCVSDKK